MKDYFLATLIRNLEYMRIKYKYIPQGIQHRYYLDTKVIKDEYACIKI